MRMTTNYAELVVAIKRGISIVWLKQPETFGITNIRYDPDFVKKGIYKEPDILFETCGKFIKKRTYRRTPSGELFVHKEVTRIEWVEVR